MVILILISSSSSFFSSFFFQKKKKHDCIAWARLNFLAARESGLDEHPGFWSFYLQFITHFIRIYEYSAPPHMQAAAEWSADPARVEQYFQNGRRFIDIPGL